MFWSEVEVVLPHATVADLRRRLGSRPRSPGSEVRMRLREDDVLVAWNRVTGVSSTGSAMLRARLQDTDAGILVRGKVAPSGPDLAVVGVLFLATAGLVALGIVLSVDIALIIAVVPLALGVAFAALLPRSVRAGRRILLQTLRDDLASAA